MEPEEILAVIDIHLEEMNNIKGKPIGQKLTEIRTVVNLLAQLILKQHKIEK